MHAKQTWFQIWTHNIQNCTYAILVSFYHISLSLTLTTHAIMHTHSHAHTRVCAVTHALLLLLLLFTSHLSGLEERYKSGQVLTEQCVYTMHVYVRARTHTNQSQLLIYFLVILHRSEFLSKASLLTLSVDKDVSFSFFILCLTRH